MLIGAWPTVKLTKSQTRGGGGGSYFPYILLNEIQTMFSQLAKRSARVLLADLVLIMRITSKSIDQRS